MTTQPSKDREHIAIARMLNLPISTKQSVEIASFIRNKTTEKAKQLLNRVLEKKTAVPFKRYNRDVGHKPGKIASGRYPQKATKEFLKLINLVEANAENKGLDTKNLVIFDIRANQGEQVLHFGRHRGRKMKRTHLTIAVKEK
jgi:large subunit ribosomal protein L22